MWVATACCAVPSEVTAGRRKSEMKILLDSLGRVDPVSSYRRISVCSVEHHRRSTTVELTLTGNHSLTYQVRGIRAPGKLARVFESNQ